MRHARLTRLLSLILVAVMLVGTLPTAAFATGTETEGNDGTVQDTPVVLDVNPDGELQQLSTETSYTVEHHLQNAEGGYTKNEAATETMTGTVGETTIAAAKAFEGYTAKTIEQKTIAAEGTVVVVYYDAVVAEPQTASYTVEHHLQNAEGVYTKDEAATETMTGTVGETTVAAAKAFEGYTAKTIEQKTIAAEGTVVVVYYDAVVAEPQTASYTVEHHLQNAEGVYTKDEAATETMTGTVGETTAAVAKTFDGYTAKTIEQKTVAAEGTVVVVYYDAVVAEPQTTSYTVEHHLQNAEGGYTKDEAATETMTGTVGETTAAVAKTFDGYTAKVIEQKTIAAEGTVVVVYYDADPVEADEETLTLSDVVTVISDKSSTLAPGITQNLISAYDKNGDRVEMFVAVADLDVETVGVYANYLNNQNEVLGMSKTTEQVAAAEAKHEEPYSVVVAINASYYNMTTGKPTGTFVMEGNDITDEKEGNNYSFFAILKDGTPIIGAKGEYSSYKGQIAEAVGGYHHIVKDGKVYGNWANDTKKYPRQTVGITADNKVVIMSADGNQAPKSIGLTMQEQAEVMIALGCVEAVHLDGGGSMTYCAKPEGADAIQILNSPSDGSERSVSNSLMVVSTAAPDGAFHHAVLTAEHDYVTPGSTVNVTAIGVDATGGSAEIPENAVWQVADAAMGTVTDGVYTAAADYTGKAAVQLVAGETVIGETTVNVVIPEKIAFKTSTITIPYGKTVTLEVTATYGVNEVTLKAEDVVFTLENEAMGTIEGFNFTAAADETVAGGKITVALTANDQVKAEANMVFGKGSEVLMDFEDNNLGEMYITTGYPQYGPKGSAKDENGNYYYNGQNELGELSIVTAENGKVHNGDYALAVECDFTQPYETGYHMLSMEGFSIEVPANAQTIGMWIHIPELEELMTTSVRLCGDTASGAAVTSPWIWDNCTPYGWENDGWRYVTMDLSGYGEEITFTDMQIYICDRDNTALGFYFKDHASVNSKFTYYIDDITVDYSSAVDDREPPEFSNLYYAVAGMPDASALNGQTVTGNTVSFSAAVAENTKKDNYTGIDAGSARAYVDGVSVGAAYSGGIMTMQDQTLADGVHTIRFEISDNMGNMSYIQRQITVNAGSDMPTVSLVPQKPDASKILIGSLYWMNLETADAATVEKVTMKLNLNSVSQWELNHMVVTPGFEGSYSIDPVTNNATVTITKTGTVEDGVTVLAQLPIRTWESRLTEYEGYENQTPTKLWSRKIIWPMDIKLSMNYGQITFADGTSGSFSMAPIAVITELYGNYGEMNAAGDYANKTNWHIHTAEKLEDKAPTCTEAGYEGRTFCKVCDSVVVWGTTKAATGHNYGLVDGVLKCSCGKLFNGVHTDGKTYVDGIVMSDGWSGESYYKDGVKLLGLQKIDGFYYDFGEDGICPGKGKVHSFYYNEDAEAYMYFTDGIMVVGEAIENPRAYYFDENGYAISGDVTVAGYACTFSEKGEFISSADASVVDAGYSGTNIEYVLLSDGTLKIDGTGEMKDYTSNGIYPAWFIKNGMEAIKAIEIGNEVTKIGKFAFFRNGYVSTLKFEENSTLKTIGWGAFGHCWRLQGEVILPASVEKLDNYAFYECGALKKVSVEEGSALKVIGYGAFLHDLALETVYIPESVVEMGEDIFHKANADLVLQVAENSLGHLYAQNHNIAVELRKGTAVKLSSGDCSETVQWTLYTNGVMEITGTGAMPNYTAHTQQPWGENRHLIKKLIIGKDITAIGNYAFCYSQNIEAIEFEEGSKLERIGVLSFFNVPKVAEIVLPDTVTYIGAYGMGDCFALTNVYIPQGMEYMLNTAFSNSAKVNLNVAKGTYAEQYAIANEIAYTVRDFEYVPMASGSCGENAIWEIYENGELYIKGNGAILNYASHKQQPWSEYRHLIKKLIIGKDITAIGNYAFCYSQNIEAIEFEEGSKLERIGVLSFFNVPKVAEIVLPDTVTYIGAYGMGDCFALTNVYIPQGMEYMLNTAFSNSAKVNLNVAKGTYAEQYAIANEIAYTVRDFEYVPMASGSCGENAIWEIYENGELYIKGNGAILNYASHKQQPWSEYRHLIKKLIIGKGITAIGNYAFCYSQNIEAIEFEEGSKLERIGVLSFFNVPKVAEIVLPDTVTYIGAYGMGDCFALTNVYIPQGMEYMLNTTFSNSAKVNLNVAKGTYAEQYAIANSIAYTVR